MRKGESLMEDEEEDDFSSDGSDDNDNRHGMWMRRRRLDGALNRVPIGFYSKVWMILENCRGIQIRGRTLDTFLTQGVSCTGYVLIQMCIHITFTFKLSAKMRFAF